MNWKQLLTVMQDSWLVCNVYDNVPRTKMQIIWLEQANRDSRPFSKRPIGDVTFLLYHNVMWGFFLYLSQWSKADFGVETCSITKFQGLIIWKKKMTCSFFSVNDRFQRLSLNIVCIVITSWIHHLKNFQ